MDYQNLISGGEGVFLFTTVPGSAQAASFALFTGDPFPWGQKGSDLKLITYLRLVLKLKMRRDISPLYCTLWLGV